MYFTNPNNRRVYDKEYQVDYTDHGKRFSGTIVLVLELARRAGINQTRWSQRFDFVVLDFRDRSLLGAAATLLPLLIWTIVKKNVHHHHNTDHGLVVHQEDGPGQVALLLLSGELLHVRVKTETKKTSRISPGSRRQPGRSEDHCWRPPGEGRGLTKRRKWLGNWIIWSEFQTLLIRSVPDLHCTIILDFQSQFLFVEPGRGDFTWQTTRQAGG